ncbi:MAG TPA: DedA family protein [Thermodesulfobacteriota bacterium]|nr:DedA family protein [Thermodesulfobacteriota bacterium]
MNLDQLILTLKPYVDEYGYWAVFGAIFFEDLGIPLPGETMLIAGSLLASQGMSNTIQVLLMAWMGAVAGDNIGYVIGRFGGRRLVLRYGRYLLVSRERLGYAERFFRKHGGAVVVVARFFAVLRQFNGIVAGIAKMSWGRFFFYNALGGALWVGLWGTLVYQLGTRVNRFLEAFKRLEVFLIGGLVLAAASLAVYFLRRHRG